MPKQVTIGRTVLYRLTAKDAEEVNRRRTTGSSIAERIRIGEWPLGAQAHIGNPEGEGSVRPMVVVHVWPDEFGPGVPGVNGRVMLDGTDVLWVTSVSEGNGPGQWHWPEMV